MIRDATHEDIPRLLEMAKRFISESVYHRNLAYNPEHLGRFMAVLIDDPNGLLKVSDANGAVIGMIGALAYVHPLSGEYVASELFWWVDPAHRGFNGPRLLREVEQWADEKDVVRLTVVAPTVEVGRLCSRKGYTAMEMHFQKDF